MPARPDNDGSVVLDLDSEIATAQLGRTLGVCAQPGLVVGLTGNLGAGKTRLVQSAAEGLGADRADVNSPTFVLIQEYDGRLPVYHFDTYRLRDEDEFLELGADEYMDGNGVCLIEWADRVADVLPRDRLTIELEMTGLESRRVRLTAGGPRSQRVLDAVRQQYISSSD